VDLGKNGKRHYLPDEGIRQSGVKGGSESRGAWNGRRRTSVKERIRCVSKKLPSLTFGESSIRERGYRVRAKSLSLPVGKYLPGQGKGKIVRDING